MALDFTVHTYLAGRELGHRRQGIRKLPLHEEASARRLVESVRTPDEDLRGLQAERVFDFLGNYSVVDLNSSVRTAGNLIWLYSLITTDYDGLGILPHFLRHYREQGISYANMFVDLLHDPSLSDHGVLSALDMTRRKGVRSRMIARAYTPDLQDLAMVSSLRSMPMHPEDWVVVADMDEFFTFGHFSNVYEAVESMSAQGATFALGETLDHVARGGLLTPITNETNVWNDYPLICPVVSTIAKGLPAKVAIHKAYLRSGAGHHHIVEPHLAQAYFGNECTGLACELVMKKYKQRTIHDVYDMTPYSQYQDRYGPCANNFGWQAKQWSIWAKAHHFKWSAAVLENLYNRMVRDSGDCVLGINENSCLPVFQFWKEVARQYHALKVTGRINITSLDCKEGVDTLWTW